MDQKPDTTPEPKDETPKPAGQNPPGGADLSKILLPKKETPGSSTQSAQRINAGALLAQEVEAASEGFTPSAPAPQEKAAESTSPNPKLPKEKPIVQQLETYQSDIENIVQEKNLSVVSIAAAEAQRHVDGAESTPAQKKTQGVRLLKNISMLSGGVLLLAAAAGALAYVIVRPQPTPPVQNTPQTTLITADASQTVVVTAEKSTRPVVMNNLEAAKEANPLSLGLISELYVSTPTTTESGNTLMPLSAQSLLTILAPQVPATLLRSIEPAYLLGVHTYNGNQPFFLFKVNSYEEAYSGMLEWETTMQADLAPLFTYTPRPHIPEEQLGSTTSTTSPLTTEGAFIDKIVENHDARVIQNQYGDILLLWTFLDRSTLVITTNPATLREIISRLKNAPIVTQPGQ